MKQGPVPQEFVYIPDDVLTLIPQHSRKPYRKENISDQNDREARGSAPYHTRLLDDLCTALARHALQLAAISKPTFVD